MIIMQKGAVGSLLFLLTFFMCANVSAATDVPQWRGPFFARVLEGDALVGKMVYPVWHADFHSSLIEPLDLLVDRPDEEFAAQKDSIIAFWAAKLPGYRAALNDMEWAVHNMLIKALLRVTDKEEVRKVIAGLTTTLSIFEIFPGTFDAQFATLCAGEYPEV